ncbi:sulfur transferase domain-containing protein [Alsobacter sp. SYSU M60028]|uniref:Sulfur transferase domain-containing protein n=1 Tax=Alsobacter ponti TaxID=2962936 RepID=A0ABT1LGA0_9HYPH|nr:sulfur transferase domain-containing protein [Alsobacter ponti]MCP8940530.1 sulfur transferase domain-containing protein [Alsobacter ponti]
MFPFRSHPQKRYQARLARIARWDRPISTPWRRFAAWANMLLTDHGVFRLVYLNRHRVTDRFWRAAQPAPGDVRAAAAAGVKTIVNLRGGREYGSWPLEKEACDAAGIALVDFVVRSRGAPEKETILQAKEFFDRIEYPVLVHCKSGADRAGFMAALYLLVHENRPLDEAMAQLHPRYGHFRFAKTGILDAFFEQYRAEGLAKGVAFLDWVAESYDPRRLEREFRPHPFSDFVVDHLLRRE